MTTILLAMFFVLVVRAVFVVAESFIDAGYNTRGFTWRAEDGRRR